MIGALAPIFLAGLVTMVGFGNTSSFFSHQLLWIGISFALCIFVASLDIRFLRDSRYVVAGFCAALVLLVFVLLFGKTIKGSRSWFSFGSFSFEPADIVKLFLILMYAKYFSRRHVEIARARTLLISFVYALVPIALIMLQPDFGSAIIVLGIWLGMALTAGISRKQLLIVGGTAAAVFVLCWFFVFKEYQKARIVTFVNPTADIRGRGYNAYQSVIAVGSGGFLGKGVGYGTQSRLNFLPEFQTDFIFAAFSEEWGWIGSCIILACFAVLLWRIIVHAKHGATNFETLFCAGFAIVLFGHLLINIGMNIGIMPVTGLPLPFMSYGGSHLLAEMIGIGMVLSMARYERALHREDLSREFLSF